MEMEWNGENGARKRLIKGSTLMIKRKWPIMTIKFRRYLHQERHKREIDALFLCNWFEQTSHLHQLIGINLLV